MNLAVSTKENFQGVRYLVISDIHLGNTKNPAWRIIRNLRRFFCDFNEEAFIDKFGIVDILFIDGDFFDKALLFSHDDIILIQSFVVDLMLFCGKMRIKLRYIEGTPSHDRKQFRNFVPLASNFQGLDFKYIEDMDVEFFEDLGISCLYVPDEHAGGGEKSQELIDKKFKELGIEKVTIAMVHSWFKHHVPEVSSSTKYDEEFFLSRVEYYISNGHIHTPSVFSNIVNQGSFDCVAHGEEHAKGGVLFDISPSDAYFFFVENKDALPFVTVLFKDNSLENALKQLEKVVQPLPEYSWVRIKAKETHPILSSLDVLTSKYPHVRFEKITIEEEERSKKQLVDQKEFEEVAYEAPRIDRDNIVEVTLEAIRATKNPSEISYSVEMLRKQLESLL